MAQLKDPAAHLEINFDKMTSEQRADVQEFMDQFSSPFELSQRKMKETRLDEKFNQLAANQSEAGAYRFDYSETADLEHMVKMGSLTPKNAALAK